MHAELAEHPAEVEGSPRLVADLEKYVDLVVEEMTYNMKVLFGGWRMVVVGGWVDFYGK